MQMTYLWLIAIILFSIIEALTSGIVSIWFAFGALAALFSSILNAPPWLQITVFLVASAISLIATRPLIKKKLLLRTTPTNADMLIGNNAIVIEEICNIENRGAVKVQGKIWSAKSLNDEIISDSSVVNIVGIEGVKLIVELSK